VLIPDELPVALPRVRHRSSPLAVHRFGLAIAAPRRILTLATTKTGVTVTGHIEEIIRDVKKIAAELGLTRIYIEKKRRKQDVNLLGQEEIAQLAEEAVNRASSAEK